jgi:hypothetical protein
MLPLADRGKRRAAATAFSRLSPIRPEAHLQRHMASLYLHDGAQALTLRIVGPLTKSSAAEVEQAWLTARSTLGSRELMVDLSDVVSVDADGETLLRRLAGHGARFITATLQTDALAEELSLRMPELLPGQRGGVWSRLACCLKTFCGVAQASVRRALPCEPNARKLW